MYFLGLQWRIEMADIALYIQKSHKLTDIFGYWPSFHDAEVIDLHLWRGNVDPEKNQYVFPVLIVTLHVWELAEQANESGHLVKRHHTLTTLRFQDVDAFSMAGFDHQNEIFELLIERRERSDGPSPFFFVELKPASDMSASFRCLRVEVAEAEQCSTEGRPAPTPSAKA
jgi:hypothetical protein